MYITFHGYEAVAGPGLRQKIWHKLGEWGTLGNICIGDFHSKWYHTKPTLVSYGAVAVQKNAKPARIPGPRIVYLGRLESDTGIMDYLEGIKGKKITLDVYGDGPLRKDAETYCKINAIKAKFHGFVPNADKFLLGYSAIFTSGYLGILEALNTRAFVISYYGTAMKCDYLAMAPFAKFIDICGSPIEISHSVDRILFSPKQLTSRVVSGYNWARSQTWEKLAANYENLWLQKN